MRILFLGYGKNETSLISFLEKEGHQVIHWDEKLTEVDPGDFDLVVSFGYRYIISAEFINNCRRPPVNLHISFLPFNRGAHPNFWAWFEGSPHGVTIHHIDEGIDTGDIIIQEKVNLSDDLTLSESYEILKQAIQKLFKSNSKEILEDLYTPFPQEGNGSIHYKRNLPKFEGGWNQTIADVRSQLEKTGL